MYVCMYVCMYECMYLCVRAWVYGYTYRCTYAETTRTGTRTWVPVPADPLTSPSPANAIPPLSHNRSIRVHLLLSYLLTLLLPSLLHPSLALVSSQKPITVGVKPMASLSGSPGTYSVTLLSQWAQQVLGHNLLLGLSSRIDIALSYCTV